METKLALTLVCAVLATSATAQAQGLTQPWDQITPLTPEDRAIIRSTVESQIHGKTDARKTALVRLCRSYGVHVC